MREISCHKPKARQLFFQMTIRRIVCALYATSSNANCRLTNSMPSCKVSFLKVSVALRIVFCQTVLRSDLSNRADRTNRQTPFSRSAEKDDYHPSVQVQSTGHNSIASVVGSFDRMKKRVIALAAISMAIGLMALVELSNSLFISTENIPRTFRDTRTRRNNHDNQRKKEEKHFPVHPVRLRSN